MTIRIEVRGRHLAAAQGFLRNAAALGIQRGVHGVTDCRISSVYFLAQNPGAESIERLCTFLLVDPVTESATWTDLTVNDPPAPPDGAHVVEVAPRPGVTDITARELKRGMEEIGLFEDTASCEVTTGVRYELVGSLTEAQVRMLAGQLLCNETIQHFSLGPMTPHFDAETDASDTVEQRRPRADSTPTRC